MTLAFSFTQPFENAFSTLMSYIPQLIGALVILVIGYFVAKIIATVVTKILSKLGFDKAMDRAGVNDFVARLGQGMTPSKLVGKILFFFVFFIFFTMFVDALGVAAVSTFLVRLIAYMPRIFAAVVILFLAALAGRAVANLVQASTRSAALAAVARYAILVFALFIALTQLRISPALIGPTFLILLAGISLAAAIAFGWAGRDLARGLLERLAASFGDGPSSRDRER